MSPQEEPGGWGAWKTPATILGVLGLIATVVGLYLANRPETPEPPGETARISVTPSSGPAGTGFLVSVEGFQEGETVRLYVDDVPQGEVRDISSFGRSGIPIAGLSSPGRHLVKAEGLTSKRSASTLVLVT